MLIRVEPGPWRFEYVPAASSTDWTAVVGLFGAVWVAVGIAYLTFLYCQTDDQDLPSWDSLVGDEWYILATLILGWPYLMVLHLLVKLGERSDALALAEARDRPEVDE